MLTITQVEYIDGYKLLLRFENEEERIIDLSAELYGEVFEPLQDTSFFSSVTINHDTATIEWSNGADFAPEFLYEKSSSLEKVTA